LFHDYLREFLDCATITQEIAVEDRDLKTNGANFRRGGMGT